MKLPHGVRDWLPGELRRKRGIEQTIRDVASRWAYEEVQTPAFERFDVLEAGLGVRLAEQTFTFNDRHGTLLALSPEMTTPIARLVSTRLRNAPLPLRLSYIAPAYRYEEPQEGRMREFTQAGCELIGSASVDADAEVLFMAMEAFDAVGLRDARFDINHAAVVDGVLEGLGLDRAQAQTAKHLIADRNVVDLRAFVVKHAPGSRDLDPLLDLALLRGDEHVLEIARKICRTPESLEGIARLQTIIGRAQALGYGERVAIDFALLRDLEYYTGFVFEGYVGEIGLSLCGGGRYDSLLPRFGYDVPAVGWMVGVERLLIALERRKAAAMHIVVAPDVIVSGSDVVAAQERHKGRIVRLDLQHRTEAELIAEARRDGIPRIIIVRDGSVKEVAVGA